MTSSAGTGGSGAEGGQWTVWRLDDNGNQVEVSAHDGLEEAEAVAAALQSRGHKQTYWVTRST